MTHPDIRSETRYRGRRSRRLDYYPDRRALEVIEAARQGANYTHTLNTIVREWAEAKPVPGSVAQQSGTSGGETVADRPQPSGSRFVVSY